MWVGSYTGPVIPANPLNLEEPAGNNNVAVSYAIGDQLYTLSEVSVSGTANTGGIFAQVYATNPAGNGPFSNLMSRANLFSSSSSAAGSNFFSSYFFFKTNEVYLSVKKLHFFVWKDASPKPSHGHLFLKLFRRCRFSFEISLHSSLKEELRGLRI